MYNSATTHATAHWNSTNSLPQTPCEFYALQLITRERNQILGLNQEYSNALCDQLLALKHRHFILSSTALQQILATFNLFSSKDPHDFHTGVLYLSCFLHTLVYLRPIGDKEKKRLESLLPNLFLSKKSNEQKRF